MRAITSAMHTTGTPPTQGFKRQVVFRVAPEEWALLQAAAKQHGSIQAALIASIQALAPQPQKTQPAPKKPTTRRTHAAPHKAARSANDEITAREAAQLLGLQTSTVKGYIRSGRLTGRYDGEPTWRGWLTTRSAVESYARR